MGRAEGGSQMAGKSAKKDLPGVSFSEPAQFIEGPRPIYGVQVRQEERLGKKGRNAPNLHMRT